MSFVEVVRVSDDGVEIVAEFDVSPLIPATREEPADGGAVLIDMYTLVNFNGEKEYVTLNKDHFPSLMADMTAEAEEAC